MPDSSNSYVTGAVLQNDVMEFSIQLEGFNEGEAVELSGSATQNNGALASFYGIQTIPALNPQGLAELTVSTKPSAPFLEGGDVTVVLRAAKVWVTVLGKDPGQLGGAQGVLAWPKVKRETAIRPYAPSAAPAGQPPPGEQPVPAA